MKKIILSVFAAAALALCAADSEGRAIADGDLVAVGADLIVLDVGTAGTVISNLPINVDNRSIIPWKIEVLDAKKSATTTSTETVYTNFVCTATTTNTISKPYFVDREVSPGVTNSVPAGITNIVTVSTVTNNFATMPSAPWTMISRSGKSVTTTNQTMVAAGGTIRLFNTEGDGWGTISLANGVAANRDVLDMSKVGYRGTMRLTATEAETARVKIRYLKLIK